ncbi:MAG: hypothetical protein J6Q44_02300, partial [Alphaproteobacteria bacterium]|nr:hypothetical protein [Alphaproteobacteria bacterium]
MKKELKISTLSIVCVLCTAIAMPSFGASAVRSIGGAGTYSSASNAATAGSKTSSGSTNSVRAGSLRATGAKTSSATSSSSTRAAATPRLSIGKYLGGATTTKPSTGSGTIDPEQSGWNDRLEARVDKLEVGVKQLQEDLNDMTDGGYRISVEEKDGELTIYQGDKKVWSGNVGSAEGLEDLQDALDALTARVSANEVAIEDLNDLVADLQVAIDGKQAAGNYAAADALADLKADVEALQGSSVSDAVIQELNTKVDE